MPGGVVEEAALEEADPLARQDLHAQAPLEDPQAVVSLGDPTTATTLA